MAKSLEIVDIPDGTYDGLWSAYYVRVIYPEAYQLRFEKPESDEFEVNEGVRGINCKCEVEIRDGIAYVK